MEEPKTAIGILSKTKVGEPADSASASTIFGKLNNISVNNRNIESKLDGVDVATSLISLRVGTMQDIIALPFNPGVNTILGYLQTGYYHIHGESFVYPKYADPVELVAASGAWNTTGNIVEIIPNTFATKPFDLHWVSIEDISNVSFGIIDFYAGEVGSEVWIAAIDTARTSNFAREVYSPLMIPQQPAGTRISAKYSNSVSGDGNVKVKVLGHFYG
jgi:hypothetical protein